ncbi:hypothetical protein [Sphingobacterium faecale]|uniref:Uncharacterized protein n=1 Tax=Sphingobacterium faecale TaxID=2803775 RepID=A0ABS1R8F0_9SPHI|nr:hypothetical protein [Sphingobacterium faecale]MBL1411006.1 hypothetical protein [Sphingobacterium faecale]
MSDTALQHQLQSIRSRLLELQNEGAAIDREKELLAFNGQIMEFMAALRQCCSDMQEQIDVRVELQDAVKLSGIKQAAYESFFQDQITFYRQWLSGFAELVHTDKGKCTVGLTVRQILLLLRLARDTGILAEQQLKPYFYFLQTSFRTNAQDSLSYESLRKKYSELDRYTIINLRRLLEEMLVQLKRYQDKTM